LHGSERAAAEEEAEKSEKPQTDERLATMNRPKEGTDSSTAKETRVEPVQGGKETHTH